MNFESVTPILSAAPWPRKIQSGVLPFALNLACASATLVIRFLDNFYLDSFGKSYDLSANDELAIASGAVLRWSVFSQNEYFSAFTLNNGLRILFDNDKVHYSLPFLVSFHLCHPILARARFFSLA
jgi:hypothetical protein